MATETARVDPGAGEQLLATKLLVPALGSEVVARPRLVERLNETTRRRVTLVAAPAGFGKTTAVDELIIVDSARTVAGVHYPGFGGIAIGEDPEMLVGLHVGRAGYEVHLTYYRFLDGAEQPGSASDTDWVGLSFERRF